MDSRVDSVDSLKLEGNAFYSKKDYEAAIRKYSEALELEPENAVVLSNRCAVFLSTQEYDRAMSDAEHSIKINPAAANIKAYYRLASAQNKLKKNDVALKTIQDGLLVLGENPESAGGSSPAPSSWALQHSSLLKLQEVVKADLKRQRIEQRKQVFFGGNLTECLACTDGGADGGVCLEDCCVNNVYVGSAKAPAGKKPTKKSQAPTLEPPQPPSSSSSSLPPAPLAAGSGEVLTATEYDMLSEVKSIMRKVRAGDYAYSKVAGGEVDMLSGTFHKLVSGENGFQESLFPGCSSKVRKTLPKNLKDLLLWKFDLSGESGSGANQKQQVQLFNESVLDHELYPKIYKSAASVLDNLIAKSDAQEAQMRKAQQSSRKALTGPPASSEPEPGSLRHPATRALLVTQIAQEAFAREIVAYVHTQNRKLSGIKAKTMLNLAVISPQNANNPQAKQILSSNHLTEATVSKLKSYAAAVTKPVAAQVGVVDALVSLQDAFMGEDWVELLADDLQRYVADEKMTTMGGEGAQATASGAGGSEIRMCWVDRDMEGPGGEETSLSIAYPAITELLDSLHALPYEINRKTECKLELLEPTRGTTLLVYYPPGSTKAAGHGFLMDSNYLLSAISQQLNGASAGGATGDKQAEDTGFRLSCTYFVMAPEAEDTDAPATAGALATLLCKDVVSMLSSDETVRAASQSYDAVSDRMILYPSGRLQHQLVEPVNAVDSSSSSNTRGFFKICYYIHGRK